MPEILWGEPLGGVRFGLARPDHAFEAGGPVQLQVFCENQSKRPVFVFGFTPSYPRALRVSPPKPHRPYIRASFADVAVLHPPEAFTWLLPGTQVSAWIDLAFVFDRRGEGDWHVMFAYDAVQAQGGVTPWEPPAEAATGVVKITVGRAQSLSDAGIAASDEEKIDAALLSGPEAAVQAIRERGPGAAVLVARRLARVLAPGAESAVGWAALAALAAMGKEGLSSLRSVEGELSHAAPVLALARALIEHRMGYPPTAEHGPFVAQLDRATREMAALSQVRITWTPYDSPVHGSRRLALAGDGGCTVWHRPAGGQAVETRDSRVSTAEVAGVLTAMRSAGIWLFTPLPRQGLPDEPRPSLQVQLGPGQDLSLELIMWNGEWRQGPAAPVAAALDDLAARYAPFPTPG